MRRRAVISQSASGRHENDSFPHCVIASQAIRPAIRVGAWKQLPYPIAVLMVNGRGPRGQCEHSQNVQGCSREKPDFEVSIHGVCDVGSRRNERVWV